MVWVNFNFVFSLKREIFFYIFLVDKLLFKVIYEISIKIYKYM